MGLLKRKPKSENVAEPKVKPARGDASSWLLGSGEAAATALLQSEEKLWKTFADFAQCASFISTICCQAKRSCSRMRNRAQEPRPRPRPEPALATTTAAGSVSRSPSLSRSLPQPLPNSGPAIVQRAAVLVLDAAVY